MLNINSSYSSASETSAVLFSDETMYCVCFIADEEGPVVESSVSSVEECSQEFVWHSQNLVDGGADNWSYEA